MAQRAAVVHFTPGLAFAPLLAAAAQPDQENPRAIHGRLTRHEQMPLSFEPHRDLAHDGKATASTADWVRGKEMGSPQLAELGLRLVSANYAAMLLKLPLDLQMEHSFIFQQTPHTASLLNYNLSTLMLCRCSPALPVKIHVT